MVSYKIQITEPAEKDIKGIIEYISRELQNPEAANRMLYKIVDKIQSLKDMPIRNKLLADERLTHMGIRKVVVENYIIFYFVNEDEKEVTILRILYGKRNWQHLLCDAHSGETI